jgi:glycosyltransferase involved in cell wall biosynthesis
MTTSVSAVPRVTALVPVYNGAAWLAQALDSALAQSFERLEVVVVDDGSTDSSGEIAQRYAAASDGRIRMLRQDNAGLPAARNAAIAAARGEMFALLDADDVWQPHHIAQAVEVLDARPLVGLVHGDVHCIDAAGGYIGDYTRCWHLHADAYRALALRYEHVCCPSAVFRRRCVEEVGGFDRQFTGLGCEDRDLWLRIAERWQVHYIDDHVAHYRVHPGSMSQNRERMALARQRLLAKLSQSPRGAPLVRHAEAMVESDLGMEYLAEGAYGRALLSQLRALRIRPQTPRVWRRMVRPTLCLVSAAIFGI